MQRLLAAYRARMIKICRAADLTPPQYWALHAIDEAQKIKMSPLAEDLGLSMGAASTLIDRLVSRGLVQREADARDRRAVYVSLTPKGAGMLEEAAKAKRDITRHAFQGMSPEMRQHLLVGLQAMVEAWERMAPCQPPEDEGPSLP